MSCKEVKSAKYQTRKSPAFHASNCKGTRKKGKDGVYVSQADKRGVYTWKKVDKPKGKFYDIHDNGGRPFRVYLYGFTASIYKGTFLDKGTSLDGTYTYDKLITTVRTNKSYLGSKGKDAGNSILLHLSGKKYMYIGSNIYEFQMEDEVDSYFSMIGNSDVPYPVLLGTQYVYFMLDHVYVSRRLFSPSMTAKQWEDAYACYYGYIDPMTGEKHSRNELSKMKKKGLLLESHAKKMNGFHLIAKA